MRFPLVRSVKHSPVIRRRKTKDAYRRGKWKIRAIKGCCFTQLSFSYFRLYFFLKKSILNRAFLSRVTIKFYYNSYKISVRACTMHACLFSTHQLSSAIVEVSQRSLPHTRREKSDYFGGQYAWLCPSVKEWLSRNRLTMIAQFGAAFHERIVRFYRDYKVVVPTTKFDFSRDPLITCPPCDLQTAVNTNHFTDGRRVCAIENNIPLVALVGLSRMTCTVTIFCYWALKLFLILLPSIKLIWSS